jgi:hypothetical protein
LQEVRRVVVPFRHYRYPACDNTPSTVANRITIPPWADCRSCDHWSPTVRTGNHGKDGITSLMASMIILPSLLLSAQRRLLVAVELERHPSQQGALI